MSEKASVDVRFTKDGTIHVQTASNNQTKWYTFFLRPLKWYSFLGNTRKYNGTHLCVSLEALGPKATNFITKNVSLFERNFFKSFMISNRHLERQVKWSVGVKRGIAIEIINVGLKCLHSFHGIGKVRAACRS